MWSIRKVWKIDDRNVRYQITSRLRSGNSFLPVFAVEMIGISDNECRDKGPKYSLIFLFHAQQKKMGRMEESRLGRAGYLTQGGVAAVAEVPGRTTRTRHGGDA